MAVAFLTILPCSLAQGANKDQLKWFAESERVHARWAMLGVAGILAQEITHPDQFWYNQNEMVTPEKALGLLALEFWAMHFVELKRWQDFRNPGSVDADPLFPANKLPAHEVGYPGGIFAPFVVSTPCMGDGLSACQLAQNTGLQVAPHRQRSDTATCSATGVRLPPPSPHAPVPSPATLMS